MKGAPRRLDAAKLGGRAGSWIDRRRRHGFRFDGRDYSGHEGDSLASALLACGVRLIGRSFKYHRPRGLLTAGSAEPNGLVEIGAGAVRESNIPATSVALYDGLVARSQNRTPSLRFDLKAAAGQAAPLLPAGFYYKTFIRPRRSWKLYEPAIRRMAGLGNPPSGVDPSDYEHFHADCDVLTIGAGIAGLTAAAAAAHGGARVVLVDENPFPGGLGDAGGGEIDGRNIAAHCADLAAELAALDNVRILLNTTAIGVYAHHYALLREHLERGEKSDENGKLRQRLWRLRPKSIIVAAGAHERPSIFCGNDVPGVMTASAVRLYAYRYGVGVGRRGVVFTDNDDAYRTALTLKEAGVAVEAIIDSRADPDGDLPRQAAAAGIDIRAGCVITAVVSRFGEVGLSGVKIAALQPSGRLNLPEKRLSCDFVAASGGWDSACHLFCHDGGRSVYDPTIAGLRPDKTTAPPGMHVVGAAAGIFDLAETIADADAVGAEAARHSATRPSRAPRRKKPTVRAPVERPTEPLWFAPAPGRRGLGRKHFVDFQNDVTVADLDLAIREGYDLAELTKRYTTAAMGTDQGKNSGVNVMAIRADAVRTPLENAATTTFRPPYAPLAFGAVAGMNADGLFKPIRETALSDRHRERGAVFEPIGLWRRPYCYPKPGESKTDAIHREVLAVRQKVGIIDVSTLGKIIVKGPDAAEFLDRIYAGRMSGLKIQRCRYGLMCNDQGFLFDDGVVARLADDAFLLFTTSGGADHVYDHLEEWAQTEWPSLRVLIQNATEQWTQIGLAGPNARDVIAKLDGDIDLSREAFPFMNWREGMLDGVAVRIFRISFSGELSYEIACARNDGPKLWDRLFEAGREFGAEAYGTEALHILRAEKFYIAIGDETDGTVTPHDLGLERLTAMDKPDFIGKRSLSLPHLKAPDRKTLVGLLPTDDKTVLPIGAQIVASRADGKPPPTPMSTLGFVTSSYWSPTLRRPIAMALISCARERIGAAVAAIGDKEGELIDAYTVSDFDDLEPLDHDDKDGSHG